MWPIAAAVSYTYVPVEFRVLFANVVALGWQVFLNLATR